MAWVVAGFFLGFSLEERQVGDGGMNAVTVLAKSIPTRFRFDRLVSEYRDTLHPIRGLAGCFLIAVWIDICRGRSWNTKLNQLRKIPHLCLFDPKTSLKYRMAYFSKEILHFARHSSGFFARVDLEFRHDDDSLHFVRFSLCSPADQLFIVTPSHPKPSPHQFFCQAVVET